jgi:DNA sulfur modification protein DndD
MGFNKYMVMAKSSEVLYQNYTAQRLQVENEKQEYLQLLDQKKKHEEQTILVQAQLQDALQYSVANKELYDNLKSGLNQESTIKNKIEQTKSQIEAIYKKETLYHDDLDVFFKDFELNVCLPKMTEAIKSEINLILKVKEQKEQSNNSNILPEQIEAISKTIIQYLKENSLVLKDITVTELVNYVVSSTNTNQEIDQYDFLEFSEVKALETLLNTRTNNVFPVLNQQQLELNVSIKQIPLLETQIENMRAQLTGRDYALIKAYEDNELSIKKFENSIFLIYHFLNEPTSSDVDRIRFSTAESNSKTFSICSSYPFERRYDFTNST